VVGNNIPKEVIQAELHRGGTQLGTLEGLPLQGRQMISELQASLGRGIAS
jgi:hypothetical protein